VTSSELKAAFDVYFREMQRCEDQKCYWALLHLLLVIPDVCGALENPSEGSGDRYIRWCRQNMPSSATVEPGDRYQMRNAVLHQGTTLADNSRTGVALKKSRYRCFSFLDPVNFSAPIHQTVSDSGEILNIDVVQLAQETRKGLENWFAALQHDPSRMAEVERNLPKLAREKPKVANVAVQTSTRVFVVEHRGITTSSS
jgi:hypothetical protein